MLIPENLNSRLEQVPTKVVCQRVGVLKDIRAVHRDTATRSDGGHPSHTDARQPGPGAVSPWYSDFFRQIADVSGIGHQTCFVEAIDPYSGFVQ